jgi:predicted cobalt transporter CbtA
LIGVPKGVYTVLSAGIIAGVFVFGVQRLKRIPLIVQAEIHDQAAHIKVPPDTTLLMLTTVMADWRRRMLGRLAKGFERAAHTLITIA